MYCSRVGSQHFYNLPAVFNFSHSNGPNSSKRSSGSVFTCFNSSLCDGKKYSKYSFGRLSQFTAIQEEEILHAAVPRIYYSSSRLQYTVHIIYSSHGNLSPNTNENICRLFQLNSTHKIRVKIRFYAVSNGHK